MYAAPGLTPEQTAEAYLRAQTRPAEESGTPRVQTPDQPVLATLQADLVKMKYRVEGLQNDVAQRDIALAAAQREMAEMSARLQAASGVTLASQDRQTIKALQKADVTQRNDIWNKELQNSAQKRTIEHLQAEVAKLRKACPPAKLAQIEAAEIVEPEQKSPPTLSQAGDIGI